MSGWDHLEDFLRYLRVERQKLSAEIDSYLESPTRTRVLTN